MNINEQGLLIAPGILQKTSPNHGGTLTEPKFIVAHWTGGTTLEGAASWLSNPAARASAHVIIGRDGKLTQLVPANVIAWHAGKSRWEVKSTKKKSTVYVGLNKYSFGIEFVNLGRLKKTEAGKFISYSGRIVEASEVVQSDVDGKYYQTYTEAQISTGDSVMVAMKAYAPSIEDVIGHNDIAPTRKIDPGPEFPLAHFKALLQGRC